LIEYCDISSREKELEAEVEKMILKIMTRRMRSVVVKIQEEEETLEESKVW
jgi:hypothetical protein